MANVLQDLINIVNEANVEMRRDLFSLSKFPDFYPCQTANASKAQLYENIISEATLAIYANFNNHYLLETTDSSKLIIFFKHFLKERIYIETNKRRLEKKAVSIFNGSLK